MHNWKEIDELGGWSMLVSHESLGLILSCWWGGQISWEIFIEFSIIPIFEMVIEGNNIIKL